MKGHGFETQRGASVIEMLIVLAVSAILVTFAVAQFGKSSSNLERQNIAKEFKTSLERARFDSVKRRAASCSDMSRVVITSPTSFMLLTDENANGTLEPASETRTIDFSNRANVQIVDDPNPTYPVVIRFDQRGQTSSGTCGAETAVDTPTVFCNMPCTLATANATNSNMVFVSPTGTAAFMSGGTTLPTFADPTVANVNSTLPVNPLLAVWDLITNTNTGNTNTGNTNTGNTNTGNTNTGNTNTGNTNTGNTNTGNTNTGNTNTGNTNTGNTNTSPTPTPTPTYCLVGQRPAVDGCVCSPTQFLQQPPTPGRCRNLH